jgi:hypothetical protein
MERADLRSVGTSGIKSRRGRAIDRGAADAVTDD